MQAMWMIGTNLMEMGNSAKAQTFVELCSSVSCVINTTQITTS